MAKAYWIVDVSVDDLLQYQKYIAATPPIIEKWGGRFLVRGGSHRLIEGEAQDRHVIIEFESYEKALACYHSDEYQSARQLRLGASHMNIVIVEGV